MAARWSGVFGFELKLETVETTAAARATAATAVCVPTSSGTRNLEFCGTESTL
jgi:hypothetical protein